jgi:hypothetical protein
VPEKELTGMDRIDRIKRDLRFEISYLRFEISNFRSVALAFILFILSIPV